MSVNERTLVKAAWLARQRAYAPYSQFKVGAAIENDKGQIFTGCNVEIANYGCTVCAERTAVLKAVSEGALRVGGLMRVVVATDTSHPTAPCGSCRQVIEEFACDSTEILISNQMGKVTKRIMHRDLLPMAFNASQIENEDEASP